MRDRFGEPNFVLARKDASLGPGERILVYSDGYPEAPTHKGRPLGLRRLTKFAVAASKLSPVEANAFISKSVLDVMEGQSIAPAQSSDETSAAQLKAPRRRGSLRVVWTT